MSNIKIYTLSDLSIAESRLGRVYPTEICWYHFKPISDIFKSETVIFDASYNSFKYAEPRVLKGSGVVSPLYIKKIKRKKGKGKYTITLDCNGNAYCTCPACAVRSTKCGHIHGLGYSMGCLEMDLKLFTKLHISNKKKKKRKLRRLSI